MKLRYHLLNVFTRDRAPLSGNPLCVFEPGPPLEAALMQALARQFNLSETTFIGPATAAGATASVRIYTPQYEMPFAGHPTLGTAHVVRRLLKGGDVLTLEMAAGLIPVSAAGDRWTLTARPSSAREPAASLSRIATALGLPPAAIAGPVRWVSTGNEQLMVPVRDARDVAAATPDQAALSALGVEIGERGKTKALVFARAGAERIVARFFFENGSLFLEDPATGSACANLGGWHIATGAAPVRLEVHQGDAIGRPSTLGLEVDASMAIRVSGEVAWLGEGELSL